MSLFGVGGGLDRRRGAGGGDFHLAVPGGETVLEFFEKSGALLGEQLGQGVLDFVGEIIFAGLRGLFCEIDLDEAQTIDRGGDKPGEIRHLFGHGGFPFLRAVKQRNSSERLT